MSSTPGDRLGPYELVAQIGAGGMGAVWKARDTRLDRIVAIKICEGRFSERFEREAKTIASLNHPHICTLYDVGDNYLVMEYLEGAPLKGPLPLGEVVRLGGQIADALDAAHRSGIVHRDLKPGNVMITAAGVKVIDFGLAKSIANRIPSSTDVTLTKPLTSEGTILGTVPYMAPEQLQGQDADARSDIFSLGCVLHEMIAGERAFSGKTPVAIMAAILEQEPSSAPAAPAWLQRLIRRCLRKAPTERWQSAGDIALELREPPEEAVPVAVSKPMWQPWAIAVVMAFVAGWLVWRGPAPNPSGSAVRATIESPERYTISSASGEGYAIVSPDGKSILFQAGTLAPPRRVELWIRSLASGDARPLVAAGAPASPVWSRDSKWIAFRTGTTVKKLEVASGRVVTILDDGREYFLGSWNAEGEILASDRKSGSIVVISDGAAAAQVVAKPPEQAIYHNPRFLPGGKGFAFSQATGAETEPSIMYAESYGATPVRIAEGMYSVAARTNGRVYLFYATQTAIVVQEFDESRKSLVGRVHTIAGRPVGTGVGSFSSSDTGTLALLPTFRPSESQPFLVSRDGEGHAVADPGGYRRPRFSPNERQVLIEKWESDRNPGDIWLIDVARKSGSPIVTDRNTWDYFPIWSPDGKEIIYTSRSTRAHRVVRRNLESGDSVAVETGLSAQSVIFPTSWSPDSLKLLASFDRRHLVAVDLAKRSSHRVTQGTGTESAGEFSPDGKFVAYTSNETGLAQVYVIPFREGGPSTAQKIRVSANGGSSPVWRRDGAEIYFLDPKGTLMAAPVSSGDPLRVGEPKALFDIGLEAGTTSFDASAGGKRFVILKTLKSDQAGTIEIISNWPALIENSDR